VDALRDSRIIGGQGMYLQVDSIGVISAAVVVLLITASKVYPGLVL